MKHFLKNSLAVLLAILMLFEAGQAGIVSAAEEIDKAINPAEHIELTVPDRFQDGESWFFIPETGYTTSEKSTEKLYIPIQRTGDLDTEAEVTLKVVDLSARHDVNYKVEIYKEDVDPEIIFDDQAIVDLILNAEEVEEVEVVADENELGALIHEAGGAEIVDSEGNTVGTVTANPLDENGNPIVEEDEATAETEAAAETEPAQTGTVEESAWTDGKPSATQSLRAARDAYTGTTSDRQELNSSVTLDNLGQSFMSEEEYNQAMAEATQESYPGKEYTLTFAPGEEAKFLVVTPMYSDAAEGDMQIMLMLKNPSEGYAIGEDVNPVTITILDEDEPEPVHIDMAADTVVAENGKAVITVNRTGRVNAIKGVTVASWDGSAKQGDDYSGIGAKLYFGMGVNTRTVEIPVGHGTEEKDFYVTITALADEEITLATTHVIIPAAEVTDDGALMGIETIEDTNHNVHGFTDPLNVRGGSIDLGSFLSDNSFFLSTRVNKEEDAHYWMNNISSYGYAYDGIYVHYDAAVKWCDADFRVVKWNGGNATRMHVNYFDSRGDYPDHWLYAAWNDPKAPDNITIEAANVDNEGPVGTDSYAEMVVDEIRLIKRQFEIELKPAEVKPLIGVSNDDVLTDYESVYLDGNTYASATHWTDDNFSVTAKTTEPLRLVGLEAKVRNTDRWVRIATIDGKSSSVTVDLNTATINALQNKGVIKWSANGQFSYSSDWQTASYNGSCYKGTIEVRPVFEYIDATVEVLSDGSGYGGLSAAAPNPSLLWDFNSDNAMNAKMGRWTNQVSYEGGSDSDGNDYYTFTATGSDPYVTVAGTVSGIDAIRYAKIRAKTSAGTDRMELFVYNNSGWTVNGITLLNDGQWHEYTVDLLSLNANDANGAITELRLDPLQGSQNGDTIQIDYIAFFPDETSARADGSELAPGKYTYHLGDVLSLSSVLTEKGVAEEMEPQGFYYELRAQGSTGELVNYNTVGYVNGSVDFALTGRSSGNQVVDRPYYQLRPLFTSDKNDLVITVADADYARLDTTKGIFAEGNHVSISHEDGVYRITVARKVYINEIYAVSAYAADGKSIPRWTTTERKTYAGDTFYLITNPQPEDNVIALTVPANQALTYMLLSGTAASSTFNLNAERSANDQIPAENAYIAYGQYGAWTDSDGWFQLPAVPACSGTLIRFLAEYNGVTAIKEVSVIGKAKLSAETLDGQSVKAINTNAGTVLLESFSATGAHVDSVFVKQEDRILGAVDALALNGYKLEVEITALGGQYVLNGERYDESITDVTVYFMDQYTGADHAVFSSNETPDKESPARWGWAPDGSGGGTFKLSITKFEPGHPNDWNYGDVLMVQLTTDRRTVTEVFTGAKGMRYDPVSTGYAVIADPTYQPQSFDYEVASVAEIIGAEPISDEDGDLLDDGTRASFGAFPYIGEITAAVKVLSFLSSSATGGEREVNAIMNDLAMLNAGGYDGDQELDDDGYEGVDSNETLTYGRNQEANGTRSHVRLSILVKFDETFYGGVRFMLGLVAGIGGGTGYRSQQNIFQSKNFFQKETGGSRAPEVTEAATGALELIYNGNGTVDDFKARMSAAFTSFAGPYFTFSVFVGVYIDFGYIELTNTSNGQVEKSHDLVFMGAGGFIGFAGSVGFTWPFALGPLPAYANVEAGASLTFFLGTSADPNKTLDEYESYAGFRKKSEIHAQDYGFNFEFKGRIYVSGTFGVGWYKVLGARITVEVAFELGYSNNVQKWYPNLFTSGFGTVAEAGFSGTIDLIVTSIPVYSASWPLPVGSGYLLYFQEVRRANKCISCVLTGVERNHGTEADRQTAVEKCDALAALVDSYPEDKSIIKEQTSALKEWARDHKIIDWPTANYIEMNKQGGIVGTIINATSADDSGVGIGYRTNPHVNSRWVAADGELMAAYSPVNTADLVTDAYAQPNSKIISIGSNKFLMVFLDDTVSRDTMMAATLKWTVYDANSDTWTDPQTVQNDATADSRPNLADAGDRIILSWASISDEKYAALKAEFTAELTEKLGVEPSPYDVQEAMEDDPARVMSLFDIFSVEFDKASETFGEITQLSDDEFYDDVPQTVYDAETTDYIVLYTKTAQDDGEYDDAGDKLLDLIGAGPNPDKTYSVIAYMLYNGVQEDDDPYDVGWVTEGFYPNELPEGWTSEDYLAAYGPERYLPSTILNEDGSYADPPISDLTVAAGLDHLAAFAFTVDKDFDLDTAEDKELYVQYYNFNTHGVYYPLRVAGDKVEETETLNTDTMEFETLRSTVQVEVGAPRLIRNGGSTFLFWREDGDTLKYMNISELLNAKVAGTESDHDGVSTELKDGGTSDAYYWKYAVQSDGSYATDAVSGETYVPRATKVDFGSVLTDSAIEITEYDVIADEADNLYVVWTDTVARENATQEAVRNSGTSIAQEVYASAMIHQPETTYAVTDTNGSETTSAGSTVRWSKPYRITRNEDFNDGLALALADDGELIIVHNRYSKLMAQSEEEVAALVAQGKIGLTQDKEGNLYAATLSYNSPVTLSVTRCDKVGSLEATLFDFSDYSPVAGETVKVTAAIENVGLINAEGCMVKFYEYKNGVQGQELYTDSSDETITVNTARKVSFDWTVPADGPEGYSIQAVIAEKRADGGWYDPVESFSDTFTAAPDFYPVIDEAVQDGDQFRVKFHVANRGNAPAEEGTSVQLVLEGLYGDLDSALYGNVEDNVLYSADISAKLPAKTATTDPETGKGKIMKSVFEDEQYVTIPASVFRFCGYDAIRLDVIDAEGNLIVESDQQLVSMDNPMNLSLNGGQAISLSVDESKDTTITYNSTVFIEESKVLYNVADPSIAAVDADGTVTGISNGTTTLTATLLPSGRSVSIKVKVGPDAEDCPKDDTCPMSAFTDVNMNAWYHDGVHWALDEGIMVGTSDTTFSPNTATTRAMLVTMLWRMEGEPEPASTETDFTDVEAGSWYEKAVLWAAETGITAGTSDTTFSPNAELTREQLATFLRRYAAYKGLDVSASADLSGYTDAGSISNFAQAPIRWAVAVGIINGTSDTTLSPRKSATRAEVATMLMRYCTKAAAAAPRHNPRETRLIE